ncbi:hypothetical protein T310_9921, partial [Rasamsonia emersonii CBS 393.64]
QKENALFPAARVLLDGHKRRQSSLCESSLQSISTILTHCTALLSVSFCQRETLTIIPIGLEQCLPTSVQLLLPSLTLKRILLQEVLALPLISASPGVN